MAIVVTRSVYFRGKELTSRTKKSMLLPAYQRPFSTTKGETVEWTRDNTRITTVVEALTPDKVSVVGYRRGRRPGDTDELVFSGKTYEGQQINQQALTCTNRRGFGFSTRISVNYHSDN